MTANQPPWPTRWLMTDERVGDRLWEAIDRLPTGAGIIFRHYRLAEGARRELGQKVADKASRRGLLLAVAGSRKLAERIGAALVHNPDRPGGLPFSLAVHDEVQARSARKAGAALVFVGPVFATRSHPDRAALGADNAARLAGLAGCPAIALGGMDEVRFNQLGLAQAGVFYGYAGIDCWIRT